MDVSSLRTDEEITGIYIKYVDTVYRIALMYLKNPAEAEDAVQTVFLKLISSDKQFESDDHIKAWLIVITQNVCRDCLKSWWQSNKVSLDKAPEISSFDDIPYDEIWQKIIAMDGKYKLPIYLFYYEGYKTDEIAQILGVKHSTVRTRLRTARKKLRLMIEEDECFE